MRLRRMIEVTEDALECGYSQAGAERIRAVMQSRKFVCSEEQAKALCRLMTRLSVGGMAIVEKYSDAKLYAALKRYFRVLEAEGDAFLGEGARIRDALNGGLGDGCRRVPRKRAMS